MTASSSASSSPVDRAAVVKEARAALDAFLDGLNSHDLEIWTATLHFPQIRVHEGAVTVWRNAEEYIESSKAELEALLASGWHHSAWDEVEFPQVSADQVHAQVRFGRHDAEGQPLGVFDSVYVVTRQNGRWGVLARIGYEA
ncbi:MULTISPECIES: hypothetical protein [unclassified Streptomyces]|uniref:hypothetical protein n=1 Tax=unclassified Streptomyces TaxID=2593676 RepID=UPI00081D907B|nr:MULTISPECIES: hypothetical protein [unclassified Streptomyces]MYZ39099.1 hypothetical protein [Streptomyces sp. SID4917]SCG02133.1 hypothetical protein GA0115259_107653 [Streptomyces sp. MnatMP-M17]